MGCSLRRPLIRPSGPPSVAAAIEGENTSRKGLVMAVPVGDPSLGFHVDVEDQAGRALHDVSLPIKLSAVQAPAFVKNVLIVEG